MAGFRTGGSWILSSRPHAVTPSHCHTLTLAVDIDSMSLLVCFSIMDAYVVLSAADPAPFVQVCTSQPASPLPLPLISHPHTLPHHTSTPSRLTPPHPPASHPHTLPHHTSTPSRITPPHPPASHPHTLLHHTPTPSCITPPHPPASHPTPSRLTPPPTGTAVWGGGGAGVLLLNGRREA